MAIITTYVCDVSGKQDIQENFFDIRVTAVPSGKTGYYQSVVMNKLIHKDVAEKLHLVIKKDNPNPEPTLESKLTSILKEYIDEVAYEAGSEAASNCNRGG